MARLPDGPIVVTAHGPLDERIAGTLRDALLPLTLAEDGRVVLDLDDAHGLDDAVLAVVARAADLIRSRGPQLAVVNRSASVDALFRSARLDDAVAMHRSLRDALDG